MHFVHFIIFLTTCFSAYGAAGGGVASTTHEDNPFARFLKKTEHKLPEIGPCFEDGRIFIAQGQEIEVFQIHEDGSIIALASATSPESSEYSIEGTIIPNMPFVILEFYKHDKSHPVVYDDEIDDTPQYFPRKREKTLIWDLRHPMTFRAPPQKREEIAESTGDGVDVDFQSYSTDGRVLFRSSKPSKRRGHLNLEFTVNTYEYSLYDLEKYFLHPHSYEPLNLLVTNPPEELDEPEQEPNWIFLNGDPKDKDHPYTHAVKKNKIHKLLWKDGEYEGLSEEGFEYNGVFHFSYDPITKYFAYLRKNSRGFYVPVIINLVENDGNPGEATDLLSPEEMRELRSNIYNFNIFNGWLSYTTHFDERIFHIKKFTAEEAGDTEVKRLLDEILSFKKTPADETSIISPELKENLLKFFETNYLPEELKIHLRNFILADRKLGDHMKFSDLLTERLCKSEILGSCVSLGKFTMPIYKAVPPRDTTTNSYQILDIHGGPHTREFSHYSPFSDLFTSFGFTHVRPNMPGSTGFGSWYRDAIDGRWWTTVNESIRSIREAMPEVSDRFISFGGSFGAYAAVASLLQGHTDYAIAINGTFDLNKHLDDTPKKSTKDDLRKQFGESKLIRRENSVTHYLNLATRDSLSRKHLLLIVGEDDDTCLPSQSETLFKLARDNGLQVTLIAIPGEGHSLSPKAMVFAMSKSLHFLNDHLSLDLSIPDLGADIIPAGIREFQSMDAEIPDLIFPPKKVSASATSGSATPAASSTPVSAPLAAERPDAPASGGGESGE